MLRGVPIRITLVRHGESTANVVQRWQGQTDAPLSDTGKQQVDALARRISRGSWKPDLIVASDLGRADTTARALGLALESDATWREADVGGWEGLTRAEVAERFGDELAALARGDDVPLGGRGESMGAFDARIDRALATVVARLQDGQNAMVVTHGGVIWSLVARALGFRRKRRPVSRLVNTSLTTLEVDGMRMRLSVYNDTMHLGADATWRGAREHDDEVAVTLVSSTSGITEPLRDVASEVRERLSRDVHELTLTPNALRTTVEQLVSPGPGAPGLARPAEGSLTRLLAGPKRVVLSDYNVVPEDVTR